MLEWWDGFWAIYSSVIFGIGINAMLALSIYLTLSCGLLSLANAAFMGIGAYAAAMISMQTNLSFPIALLTSAITPAVVALAIGIPTLRLSGVYLAMATLRHHRRPHGLKWDSAKDRMVAYRVTPWRHAIYAGKDAPLKDRQGF